MAANVPAPPSSSVSLDETFSVNGTLANGSAKLSTSASRAARPLIAGPPRPESPFPIVLRGAVQKGYGRGGKDLDCPTANLPDEALGPFLDVEAKPKTGVYYGFAQVLLPRSSTSTSFERKSEPNAAVETTKEPLNHLTTFHEIDTGVYPMVMSVGWNPFYKNDRLSAEVHIMHEYPYDFYGHEMRVLMLGYIRPEYDYTSKEALIEDIETDKKVALNSLERPAYAENVRHEAFEHVGGQRDNGTGMTSSVSTDGQD